MRKTASFIAVALVLSGGRAFAAELEQTDVSAAPSPWVVQVTPYMWAAGMEGRISPFRRAPTIEVDKSFSDVLDDLNVGGFLNLWARNDRLVLSGDLMYVNTTDSHVVGALPVLGPTPGLSASVDSGEFMATAQAGYRVYETPQFTLDLLGGLRVWHISTDVTVSYGNYALSHKESFGWVDPVVSLRGFYNITDKVSVMAQGDVGGFGIGSDFTWQFMATLNYAFNDRYAMSAGYKVLSVDYDRNSHVFDTALSGPVLGLTYRF